MTWPTFTTQGTHPFSSWDGVLAACAHPSFRIYYKAPLDHNARRVRVLKVFKNRKVRIAAGDYVGTIDHAHLDRLTFEVKP